MQKNIVNLKSDNTNGATKEVIKEINKVSERTYYEAYGYDKVSKETKNLLQNFFEKDDIEVFFVANGSASNVLLLSNYINETNSVICSDCAHILDSESNALGFFCHGSSYETIKSKNGKICPQELEKKIKTLKNNTNPDGSLVPSVVSVTQLNEHGCIYSKSEIEKICTLAHSANLKVHIDGARFLYILAKTDEKPSNLTWKLGVDAISLGFTKLGAINSEVIVFFNKNDVKSSFKRMLKRSGHMTAKTQFISCQVKAMLENDTYKKYALNALNKASAIYEGIKNIENIKVLYDVDANHLFLEIKNSLLTKLQENNVLFYEWEKKETTTIIRLVTSFTTSDDDVKTLLNIINNS